MNALEQAQLAKDASFTLASVSGEIKNKALKRMAGALDKHRPEILKENKKDLNRAKKSKLKEALIKRLVITDQKIDLMIAGIHDVIRLDDPLGKKLLSRELDESLVLNQVTVPLGVIGVIFESRPDVLVQISSLCLKSGNVVILKGGSEAAYSNKELFTLLRDAVENTDSKLKNVLHLAETREHIRELLKLDSLIDLMIPRGSNELVRNIQENTKIPVLGHADGICHLYIDSEADVEMALNVTYDAKCQYPAVCNAIETLLVHAEIAGQLLPELREKLKGVDIRGDKRTCALISAEKVSKSDWRTEYNDLILSIKVVDSAVEAINHINTCGSHHTDGIITENDGTALSFIERVDSSSVMWNCSTRFSDGFRYGLGAEVGVSTGKIHARGPVGLEGLTSTKYILTGKGHRVSEYVDGGKTFTHRDLI